MTNETENKRLLTVIFKKGRKRLVSNWEILIRRPTPEEKGQYYGTGIYLSCCPIRKDGSLDEGAAFMWDMRYACEHDADKLLDMLVRDCFCHEKFTVKKKYIQYAV